MFVDTRHKTVLDVCAEVARTTRTAVAVIDPVAHRSGATPPASSAARRGPRRRTPHELLVALSLRGSCLPIGPSTSTPASAVPAMPAMVPAAVTSSDVVVLSGGPGAAAASGDDHCELWLLGELIDGEQIVWIWLAKNSHQSPTRTGLLVVGAKPLSRTTEKHRKRIGFLTPDRVPWA